VKFEAKNDLLKAVFPVTSGLMGSLGPTKHRLLITHFSFKLHF